MMNGFNWNSGMGWGGGGSILSIVLIGVIVIGIVYFIIRFNDKSKGLQPSDNDETAEEILKKRYASGEITREEYLQMRSVINDISDRKNLT